MKPLIIQPFCKNHLTGVIDVILPIQQSEFNLSITLEEQPDLLDIPGVYQKGGGNFWVALDHTSVVGTIALIDIGNGQGAIRKMFVKSTYRGTRFKTAQALLKTLLDWCGPHQMDTLYLGTTSRFLAAHRFYEKNGFIEIAQTHLPDSFPVMAVDTKFYRYALHRSPKAPEAL